MITNRCQTVQSKCSWSLTFNHLYGLATLSCHLWSLQSIWLSHQFQFSHFSSVCYGISFSIGPKLVFWFWFQWKLEDLWKYCWDIDTARSPIYFALIRQYHPRIHLLGSTLQDLLLKENKRLTIQEHVCWKTDILSCEWTVQKVINEKVNYLTFNL